MLTNKLIQLLPILSKDATRNHIQHVLLDVVDGEINLIATDGNRMTINKDKNDQMLEILGDKKMMIHSDQIKILKAAKIKHLYKIDRKNETLVINDQVIIQFKWDETNYFPNYKAVIPNYGKDNVLEFGVNAEYIYDAITSMRHGAKNNIKITVPLDVNGYKSAITIHSTDPEVAGVAYVMPLKL